jgi:hypothetical protein
MAWRREPFYSALKRWSHGVSGTGRQVAVAAGRRLWIIAPNQDLDLGELDPNSSIETEELPDGTVRVRVTPVA